MLRRGLLWTAAVLVVGLLVIQLVPYGRDHTNPAVVGEPAWDSAATRAYAVTACFDCHSNETRWPWYTNIAPISWLVQHDVEEGRQAVNFSEWGRAGEADDAAETVADNQMPPFVYVILHPDANLSDTDKQAFIQGLTATFGGEGGE